jgi:hypothetical protein
MGRFEAILGDFPKSYGPESGKVFNCCNDAAGGWASFIDPTSENKSWISTKRTQTPYYQSIIYRLEEGSNEKNRRGKAIAS